MASDPSPEAVEAARWIVDDGVESHEGLAEHIQAAIDAATARLAAEVAHLRDTWVDPEHARALGEELTAAVNEVERLRGAIGLAGVRVAGLLDNRESRLTTWQRSTLRNVHDVLSAALAPPAGGG